MRVLAAKGSGGLIGSRNARPSDARCYQQLQEQGLAYPCFCSPDKLALARKTQLAAGRAPRYPGTCARLTAEAVARFRAQGQQPSLRFRVPAGTTIEFDDFGEGSSIFPHGRHRRFRDPAIRRQRRVLFLQRHR